MSSVSANVNHRVFFNSITNNPRKDYNECCSYDFKGKNVTLIDGTIDLFPQAREIAKSYYPFNSYYLSLVV